MISFVFEYRSDLRVRIGHTVKSHSVPGPSDFTDCTHGKFLLYIACTKKAFKLQEKVDLSRVQNVVRCKKAHHTCCDLGELSTSKMMLVLFACMLTALTNFLKAATLCHYIKLTLCNFSTKKMTVSKIHFFAQFFGTLGNSTPATDNWGQQRHEKQ